MTKFWGSRKFFYWVLKAFVGKGNRGKDFLRSLGKSEIGVCVSRDDFLGQSIFFSEKHLVWVVDRNELLKLHSLRFSEKVTDCRLFGRNLDLLNGGGAFCASEKSH